MKTKTVKTKTIKVKSKINKTKKYLESLKVVNEYVPNSSITPNGNFVYKKIDGNFINGFELVDTFANNRYYGEIRCNPYYSFKSEKVYILERGFNVVTIERRYIKHYNINYTFRLNIYSLYNLEKYNKVFNDILTSIAKILLNYDNMKVVFSSRRKMSKDLYDKKSQEYLKQINKYIILS